MFATYDRLYDASSAPYSLRAIMRTAPALTPEDSLARFLQALRRQSAQSLPILRQGRIVGIVTQDRIATLLNQASEDATEQILQSPLCDVLQTASIVAHPDMSVDDVRRLCREGMTGLLECVPVVDDEGFCLGIIQPCDLFLPATPRPKPAIIGGMATPFGVYLTDGNLQAGAGNLGLMASGAVMAIMLIVGSFGGRAVLLGLAHLLHLSGTRLLDPSYAPPLQQPLLGILSVLLKAVVAVPFFILMRLSILAGYHAAEHQTVHAIEYDEPLVPEVVARMPRAHPRCGTNLVAAMSLFLLFSYLFGYLVSDTQLAMILAALPTLFTWRTFGTFLQERFTTRTATPKQLANGIAAGNELLARYMSSPPRRTRFLRKIWCMGLIQSLIGMLLVLGVVAVIQPYIGPYFGWLF